jgi:hypothetical protein
MPLPMTVVMAIRRLTLGERRRGTRNPLTFRIGLEMNAGHRSVFACGDMTHRGLRADGVCIQQAEEDQAQPEQTQQNR